NKHKTTNGDILVAEIVLITELVSKKIKVKKRLLSLVEEARSTILQSSLANDYVIKIYFKDIYVYFKNLDISTITSERLDQFLIKVKVFHERLKKHYFEYMVKEFKSIDFTDNQFSRVSDKIDRLIDCLLPYLL